MNPEQIEWVRAYEAEEDRMRREFMAIVAARTDADSPHSKIVSDALNIWAIANETVKRFDRT